MGGELQDFNPLGSPLTRGILLCRDSNFLTDSEAVHPAFPLLAGRDSIAEHDGGVGHLDPPQHAISSLNENPARSSGPIARRRYHLALEHAVYREPALAQQQQCRQQETAASLHTESDATPPSRVPR